MIREILSMGHTKAILKSDNGAAIDALARSVKGMSLPTTFAQARAVDQRIAEGVRPDDKGCS